MKIYCATFKNSGMEQCCRFLFYLFDLFVLCWYGFHGLSEKPVRFYVVYINIYTLFFIFFLLERRCNAHNLAHTQVKSGSRLRQARVPQYQLHAILMFWWVKQIKTNKKKRWWWRKKKNYNSKHWELWISEEEKNPFCF